MSSINAFGEYPVSEAHLEVARLYSHPSLLGPKMCDELIAFVGHMLSDEEAEVMRYMKPWRPRTAAGLAKAAGRSVDEVAPVLHRLAHEKYVLISFGTGRHERFNMVPIVPGTFESVLMRVSPDSVTEWHRRFAELYEALFETGFLTDHFKKPTEAVRYLPVGEVISQEPMALPSDRLEAVLERFDTFAIGVCQCRLSKQLVGEGCGGMLETCTVMGPISGVLVRQGRMKQASRKDIIEVKAAAEKEGLITWTMNPENSRFGNCACSCCGCCCGILRVVTDFNAPGFIAPPHFMPEVKKAGCKQCGKCVQACQMKALVLTGDGDSMRIVHRSERCIGCGLCAVACPNGIRAMRPVPGYKEPPGGWFTYVTRYTPAYISNYRGARAARRA